MIVVRFKVRCHPEKTGDVAAAMRDVVAPSRKIKGVIHFDVARDVTDPNCLIAIEVFEDRAAMERQESQPGVADVMALIDSGALAAEPEWTVYDVTEAETE